MERKMNETIVAAIAIAALIQSSAAQTDHVVGGSLGWTVPSSGSYYSSWAANQTFSVGHILVFSFANNVQDVAQVTKADYAACSTTNPILLANTNPARITLNATGEYYFICNFTGHCAAGQKLMVNVSAATSSTPASHPSPPSSSPDPQPSPPSSPAPQPTTPTAVSAPSPATVSAPRPSLISASSPAPVSAPRPSPVSASSPAPLSAPRPSPVSASSPAPLSAPRPSPVSASSPAPLSAPRPSPVSAPSPAPSRSSVTYTVLDSTGWVIPTNGAAAYQTWAVGKTFAVGDTLVFNYANGAHNVAEVTKEAYGSCNTTSPIFLNSSPPTRITLTNPGQHFFICAFPQHCSLGQKLAINVTGRAGRATAPPPGTLSTPPTSTTPLLPSPAGVSAPPPPGSSASSLGVAGISATFLSIFVALLYLDSI